MSTKFQTENDQRKVTNPIWGSLVIAICFSYLGVVVWRLYRWETTGVDPRNALFNFIFVDYANVSIPVSFGLLLVGVAFSWRHFRKTGRLGISPFLLVVAVVAVTLFTYIMSK